MDVPNVSRTEYQLVCYFQARFALRIAIDFQLQVNIDDGYLNLMTNDGTPKDDVKVPEGDLGKQIQDNFDEGKEVLVTIVSAMGEEAAISSKEAPKGS
jgi:translation initiation factor 5A